jgi:hypothetical protein
MGGGGPAVRTPCGVERVWGLASTGGRRPDRVLAGHGATLFQAGARRGRLTHGPRLAAGEGGGRETRAARGPAWKKKAWAEPDGTVMFGIYSNQFQLVRFVLSKRWTYQASKIPNKICWK